MKEELLKLLRSREGFLSGQAICDSLGVSRTAVWKWVNQLKEEGYEVESVTRKGYRLVSSPNRITREEVERGLTTRMIGRNYIYMEEIDSTNEEVKRLAGKGAPHGTVVAADTQTKGKGRRGRSWNSPKGDSISMSLLLRPEMETLHASMLTLVIALAAAEAVEEVTGLSCQIKWPNDLVCNDKKMCGILTEMSADIEYIHYVVIGIGINANAETFPEEIASMATSLKKESGREVNRADLVAAVLNHFETDYETFMKHSSLEPLREAYNERLINIGRQVKIISQGETKIRTSQGIDADGSLVVCDETGKTEKIISGEVSVRGLYGYV
jgi:BirA family biotin operon repressor/biotin-[acetyl-CoA-carboxylase] ligase